MSTTIVPAVEQSEQQRVTALAAANRIRIQRAKLRGEIRQLGYQEGRHVLADAIETLPDWFASIDCEKAVGLAPSVGSDTVDATLRVAHIHQKRPLSSLSPRQRLVIADSLRAIGYRQQQRAAA